MISRWLRILTPLVVIAAAPFLLIVACQSKLLYMPRAYPPEAVGNWQKNSHGKPVDFTTSQGKQRAFLQGNLDSPRNLWVVCGGNATLVLEWSSWLARHAPPEDAWLLVDFPGYGASEGSPNPRRIHETFQTVIPIAAESVGLTSDPDPSRLRFFGHSLGAAACLIAASEFDIRNGVLLSPFTSTMDMSRLVVGVPLGFLVTHRFDNAARLDEIIVRGPADITILHGTRDEVIPFEMGRSLAEGRGDHVRLIPIESGRHNDISQMHSEVLAKALMATGNIRTGQ
jgi:pimeloyl-ACP methyl ester carboxylesterase